MLPDYSISAVSDVVSLRILQKIAVVTNAIIGARSGMYQNELASATCW